MAIAHIHKLISPAHRLATRKRQEGLAETISLTKMLEIMSGAQTHTGSLKFYVVRAELLQDFSIWNQVPELLPCPASTFVIEFFCVTLDFDLGLCFWHLLLFDKIKYLVSMDLKEEFTRVVATLVVLKLAVAQLPVLQRLKTDAACSISWSGNQ